MPREPRYPNGQAKRAHHNCSGGSLLLPRMARRALAQRFPMVLKPIHHFTNFMPDQDRPTTPNCPARTTSPPAPAPLLASIYLPAADKLQVKLQKAPTVLKPPSPTPRALEQSQSLIPPERQRDSDTVKVLPNRISQPPQTQHQPGGGK